MSTSTTEAIQTTGKRIYNFSAGPATLPEEVLRTAQHDLWNIDDSGIGILEHSHRGAVVDRVFDEADADLRRIAGITGDYDILFLQGGATLQFTMVPMNFLAARRTADYLDTGSWTSKAIKEAKHFGEVNVAFEGKTTDYQNIPTKLSLTADELRKAYTANISKGGLMFTIERPVTIPATVSCTLSLPDGQTVELSGEVRHVEPSPTSNECEVGVQFTALAPAVRATLEKSVAAFAAGK